MKSRSRVVSDTFIDLLDDCRSRIDVALRSLVDSHEPAYLYDPVEYVFQGKGKRLRPILVLLVARMFHAKEDDALEAALAVELLHNFSLVHDDIMDRDDIRHGLPSVYKKWDESTAILAGDAILAMAYGEVAKVRTGPLACLRAFNEATIRLCEGQAVDKEFESRKYVSVDDYLRMVELKTGTLLSLCCRLGAIVGGAGPENEMALAEFGSLLGQSFQIQDDLLEIYSSTEEMGKSLGSDVVTRKQTFLTCRALEQDADRWRKFMASSTGRDITSEVLPALRTYFEETGIAQGAKKQVSQLISRSRSKLERFDPVDRRELEEFVEMLMARKN